LKESDDNKIDGRGPFSGQIMSATKGACWEAFLSKSVRLMEAMYTCDIQIAANFLGKMYAVLGRRRSKILKEEMKEGTYMYSIQALLPVVESFGLSEEILKQTSGAASIQLLFR
jgi:ribosome assembly protein 1